jgi:hypothetical protein
LGPRSDGDGGGAVGIRLETRLDMGGQAWGGSRGWNFTRKMVKRVKAHRKWVKWVKLHRKWVEMGETSRAIG